MARYRHLARTCVLTGRAARCLLRYARGRHDDRAQAREPLSRQVTRQKARLGLAHKQVGRDQVRDRQQRANDAALCDHPRGRRSARGVARPAVLAMTSCAFRSGAVSMLGDAVTKPAMDCHFRCAIRFSAGQGDTPRVMSAICYETCCGMDCCCASRVSAGRTGT